MGGHKICRPSLLANQLKEFGAVNIGAAGTFVFHKPVGRTRLRSELLRCLPFEPEIVICSGRELIAATSNNPFASEPARPDINRFVSLLAKRPRALPSIPLQLPAEGRWVVRILSVHERFLFGIYRREMKTIGHLATLDKLFGVPLTTRGWNTINAVLKVLQEF